MSSRGLEPEVPDNGPPKWRRWAAGVMRLWRESQIFAGEGCALVDIPGGGGKTLNIELTPEVVATTIRRPFQLLPALNDAGDICVQVLASTLGGDLPDGMSVTDEPPFLLMAQAGTRRVYAKLTIAVDDETGVVTIEGREIVDRDDEAPEDTATVFYSLIGGYEYDFETGLIVNNVAYGPIDVKICADLTYDPPRRTVDFYHG